MRRRGFEPRTSELRCLALYPVELTAQPVRDIPPKRGQGRAFLMGWERLVLTDRRVPTRFCGRCLVLSRRGRSEKIGPVLVWSCDRPRPQTGSRRRGARTASRGGPGRTARVGRCDRARILRSMARTWSCSSGSRGHGSPGCRTSASSAWADAAAIGSSCSTSTPAHLVELARISPVRSEAGQPARPRPHGARRPMRPRVDPLLDGPHLVLLVRISRARIARLSDRRVQRPARRCRNRAELLQHDAGAPGRDFARAERGWPAGAAPAARRAPADATARGSAPRWRAPAAARPDLAGTDRQAVGPARPAPGPDAAAIGPSCRSTTPAHLVELGEISPVRSEDGPPARPWPHGARWPMRPRADPPPLDGAHLVLLVRISRARIARLSDQRVQRLGRRCRDRVELLQHDAGDTKLLPAPFAE